MIIYLATNTVNGKQYVGQTVKLFEIRKSQHLSKTRLNAKCAFHSALNKYGEEAFKWEIVEGCANIDDLNEAEEMWIEKLNTIAPNGYNLTTGGFNYIVSDEAKKKMSKSKRGIKLSKEHRESLSKVRKGRIFSDEHRKKLSASKRGQDNPNYGKIFSDEHRKKISNGMRGHKNTLGYKHSAEACKKMSDSAKARYRRIL